MVFVAIAIALIQGLIATGLLAVIFAVVHAVAPTFVAPFSCWWGMLLCLPGLFMARFFSNFCKGRF